MAALRLAVAFLAWDAMKNIPEGVVAYGDSGGVMKDEETLGATSVNPY